MQYGPRVLRRSAATFGPETSPAAVATWQTRAVRHGFQTLSRSATRNARSHVMTTT